MVSASCSISSGFPPQSRSARPLTSPVISLPAPLSRSVAADSGSSDRSFRTAVPPVPSSRRTASSASGGQGRRAPIRAIGSALSRRARNATSRSESGSAQWRSSSTNSSGGPLRDRRLRSARRKGTDGSVAEPSPAAGSPVPSRSNPSRTWAARPNGIAVSIGYPRPSRTSKPDPANSTAASRTEVLPSPASPTTNRSPPWPARARARHPATSASTACRSRSDSVMNLRIQHMPPVRNRPPRDPAGPPGPQLPGSRRQGSPGADASGSTPGRIRTCDIRLRRPALYPAELRGQGV